MHKSLPILAVLFLVFASSIAMAQTVQVPATVGPSPVPPSSAGGKTATTASEPANADCQTTLGDQTDVAVTIYNSNLALVRDRRKLTLPQGELRVRFMDVPQQVRPETVSLQSISHPGSVHILEQNYEFDLISPTKLMEKYVGKSVRLYNFDRELELPQSKSAELLSVNDGPVFKVGNEIFIGHPGIVVLPEIPANLIAQPTLVWMVNNTAADQELEATYLTNGMRWNADYVATLNEAEGKMDLNGWVTLTNESGAQYTNAKLKLVAGDVNIAQPPPMPMMAKREMFDVAAAPPEMRQEAFGEYHLYSLPRRTTIKQNQSKQVSLLTAENVGVQKIYEYRGDMGFFVQRIPPMKEQKVDVFLKFRNAEKNSLGMPLPAGVIRVYQKDSEGMLQFAGEDRIEHTPKDEDIRLKLGSAFDVVAERTQTDYQRPADNLHESSFEIKVRNHKTNDITVDIIEPMNGDWTVLQSSHKYVKRDAQTAVFSVPVPADKETVVTYKVRVRF